MTDRMTSKQWFAHMLTEHLGDPNVEKKGGVWPPAGEYVVTFQGLDKDRADDMSPPNCLNIQHGFIKVPYVVDEAALPTVRNKQYDYLLWFTNDVGAQMSLDRLCDLIGRPRPKFNTKVGSDPIFDLAESLNGHTVRMKRTIEPDKKGVRRAKDVFTALIPTEPQIKSQPAPEPSPDAVQRVASDIPF